ncbi:MAG: 23S rRNA (pseudouridine(1915)-N(3))-methyltransferase RlmH [Acidobacteriota bacterium]
MIKILAIGRKHESWITDGLERYQKRLKAPWNAEWVLLPHSAREGLAARQEESSAILSRLKPDDFVILLDERGKLLDSPALSRQIEQVFPTSKTPVCIIGGAYGVDDSLASRANLTWSLSPLVFPHQLVRLILAEQLYRAQEIAAGHPYHHQ